MKALAPYVGGKARHAKWIAAELDKCEHKCYIEPYCGMASVFFAKQRAKINILNDFNHNITAIYLALRDCPDELLHLLSLMEYSEDLFYEANRRLFEPDLSVARRAAYHLFLLNAGCGRAHNKAVQAHGFTHGIQDICATGANRHTGNTNRVLDKYGYHIEALRCRIQILNRDGMNLVKRFDKPGVLMYIDPPYETDKSSGFGAI